MTYSIIVAWDSDGNIQKTNVVDTEEQAKTCVSACVASGDNDAFYLEDKVADGLEAWRQPDVWTVSDGSATLNQTIVDSNKASDAIDAILSKRANSYPSIGDQLDAIWKGGDDQAAMKVLVDKVKSDNPKE
jgi:hypothetical protein